MRDRTSISPRFVRVRTSSGKVVMISAGQGGRGGRTQRATAVILNVVLGAALWASSAITRKNLMNGAIVAGVISIVLIYFGGRAGQIGGIVGILGAILAAAKPYLPWSRHD